MRRIVRITGTLLLVAAAWPCSSGCSSSGAGRTRSPRSTRTWKQHQLAQSYERRATAFRLPRAELERRPRSRVVTAGQIARGGAPLPAGVGARPGDRSASRVPRLGLNMVVVNGTDDGSLKKGPGLDRRTYMPGEGQLIYIAGHRTTYLAPFAHIERHPERATPSRLEVPYGTFRYRVFTHRIVDADDLAVLQLARARDRRAAGLPPALLRVAALHRLRAARCRSSRVARRRSARRHAPWPPRRSLPRRADRPQLSTRKRASEPAGSSPSPRGSVQEHVLADAARAIMRDSWPAQRLGNDGKAVAGGPPISPHVETGRVRCSRPHGGLKCPRLERWTRGRQTLQGRAGRAGRRARTRRARTRDCRAGRTPGFPSRTPKLSGLPGLEPPRPRRPHARRAQPRFRARGRAGRRRLRPRSRARPPRARARAHSRCASSSSATAGRTSASAPAEDELCSQHHAVGLIDLSQARAAGRVPSKLRSGRQDGGARPPSRLHRRGSPAAARPPICAGTKRCVPARATRLAAGLDVTPARAHVGTGRNGILDLHVVVTYRQHTRWGMTASAPSGTTPPVAIPIASPYSQWLRSAGRPAANAEGRPAATRACPPSGLRTRPSLELAKGGRSTCATCILREEPSTSPLPSATGSFGNGSAPSARTSSSASSMLSSGGMNAA